MLKRLVLFTVMLCLIEDLSINVKLNSKGYAKSEAK
jgi:hypothetical protein